MGVYTYEDLKEAFKYARKNQKSKLEEFLEYRSLFITKKDLKKYNDIKYNTFYITVDSKKYIFYYFKSTCHDSLSKFTNRFIGNKTYFEFSPVETYGYSYCIISFNVKFYDVDEWDDFADEYKGVKSIKNENFEFIFDDFSDNIDENVINDYCRYLDDKGRIYTEFWDMKSTVKLYMNKYSNIEFSPIDTLFKIIKT